MNCTGLLKPKAEMTSIHVIDVHTAFIAYKTVFEPYWRFASGSLLALSQAFMPCEAYLYCRRRIFKNVDFKPKNR